jgi:integrase
MRGTIARRGKHSWRIKFDIERDPATGRRQTRYATVKGTKRDAQIELTRLLAAHNSGSLVEPNKLTVAGYVRSWIDTAEAMTIAPKTAERYRQLIERQICPHVGAYPLQKLKAAHITSWHAILLKEGGYEGGPLSPRSVGHAHRVLRKSLADAVKHELLTRNPAAIVSPPKVTDDEMKMLNAEQVKTVLMALRETVIFPQIVLLLSTGMRRGELMGLQWGDVNLHTAKLRIERSVEKTKVRGLRVKAPKTKHGRRTITLPSGAVEILRQHRKAQLARRIALGLGKLPDEAFVFGTVEGKVLDPDRITQDWKRFAAARDLPKVTLQALRHSHASALIASGSDAVTVSRRLGHASPVITMSTYAHLFDRSDEAAAKAIDTVINIGESCCLGANGVPIRETFAKT